MREPGPYAPLAFGECARSSSGGAASTVPGSGSSARAGRPSVPPVTNEPFIDSEPADAYAMSGNKSPGRTAYENSSAAPAGPSGVASRARRGGSPLPLPPPPLPLLPPSRMYGDPSAVSTSRAPVNSTLYATSEPAGRRPSPGSPTETPDTDGAPIANICTRWFSASTTAIIVPDGPNATPTGWSNSPSAAPRPPLPSAYAGLPSASSIGRRPEAAAPATAERQSGPSSGGSM